MEAFFIYFLKSSGVILLFLACYKFLLSRETFHSSNRYFLLSGLALAIILPLISYTKTIWIEMPSFDIPLTESIIPQTTNEVVTQIELSSILFMIYAIGILIGTIRLLVQLLSLRKVFRNSTIVQAGKFKILESNKSIQPFSFFNYIIYHPESHSEEDIKSILAHEKVHSSQYHSVDILAMHLFSIFQWCNPFIYMYKFYLKENLEFVADASTISTEIQKESYQYLLVKNTLGKKHFDFVNPFFNSSVKKRIVMLNKKKSKKRNSIKYGLVLPLLVGFILLFNVETVAKIRTAYPSTISTEQDVQLIDPKVYSISKEASDKEIAALKKEIKNEQGELIIENLKRNSNGKIIAISVTYKVKEGGYATGNYDEEDNINTIHFGQNQKGGLFISTDEANLSELKKGIMPKIKKQDFSRADVYSIHKKTSDKELEEIKSTIEKKGGEFSYTHKRNSKGEIIDLELEIRSNGTGHFKSEPPFERCYFGSFHGGGIFIADDEKSFNQLKKRNSKVGKGLGNNLKEIKNDKFNEVVYDKEKTGDFPHAIGLNYRYSGTYQPYTGPSYYVNGIETPSITVSTISPKNIESITVLKGQTAVSVYGEKGENGVVNIKTKDALYPNLNTLKVPNLIRVGSKETNNNTEKSQLDEKSTDFSKSISKTTTKKQLKNVQQEMLRNELEVAFRKVERNKKGEIVKIIISVKDELSNKKVTASFSSRNKPIPVILIGRVNNQAVATSSF